MKFTSIISAVAVLTISGICFAGAIGGPKGSRDVVLPYATDFYDVPFYGNSRAHVEVKGDGSTDLDCVVIDNNGNRVARDMDSTDYCILDWVPRWNGMFRILITNQGGESNVYGVITN